MDSYGFGDDLAGRDLVPVGGGAGGGGEGGDEEEENEEDNDDAGWKKDLLEPRDARALMG